MKLNFFGATLTITRKAKIAFVMLIAIYAYVMPVDNLYSAYSFELIGVFVFLSSLVGILFVEGSGELNI